MKSKTVKKENKLLFFGILGIISLIVAIVGATVAFFSATVNSTGLITGSTGLDSNSLKLDIKQLSAGSGKLIPQVDYEIGNAASGKGQNAKSTCIDKNDNTVCKVYSITVTNLAPVKMNAVGLLTLTADDMPNLKWAIGTSATTGFPTPSGAYYTKEDTMLGKRTLEAYGNDGSSATFYVVIWISESNDIQGDNGKFKGTVSFSGYTTEQDGNDLQGITSTFRG